MAQNKYLLFKDEDAKRFLSPVQKEQLIGILQTISEGRRQGGKSVGDLFFVLNMKDQYALEAIEAYIAAIRNDGIAANNIGVQAALDTAVSVRQTAALTVTTHLPD